MKICVVGSGYVGLVTAGCLAEAGSDVVCVDNDSEKIKGLKDGIIPFYEPGLTEIIKHNTKLGRLNFTADLKLGIDNSLIIFLAVGTPSGADGSADISDVLAVSAEIGENLSDYRIIATKSTVPVGTYKKVTDVIKSKTEIPFDYVSNPEFLKEGAAVEDFMFPERIIIGTINPAVKEIMKQLYSPFMRKRNRILFMDPASAEMTKYAANTMLATRISFMNEISALCEKLGVDVEHVRAGIGSDSRIGPSFLFPGLGFGGSCFPKDVRALIHTGSQHGVEMAIARSVEQVNINAQERFAQRIKDYFSGRENETVLAVWGLAFKAKTDDVRESPAIYCIKKLLDCRMKIKAYDPEAMPDAVEALEDKIETFQNGYDALDNADALVIFTDWQEFRNPDFEVIAGKLKKAVIFDGRNLYDPSYVRKMGIEYHSVGRP
ncbi:MAG: nucleotide sugar dehydrogenase [Phycisphaerae bacterium]|nr:UDP-glucose/GDP-mannose dehydrogenase family protein [Phycisphaerae bacterium]NIP52955.1 UDP-glucose/GDP-mannose dehydrogenase family protein [Phycisphaerae bacterium]NIS52006.1 UDP-glucose/GDP-mannose dehydrogenase family protein [Phycisphaerae bacterium]NIU09520.1 UDP-glucose/GDP-mannose dehydrogenase family protein [Phycisphaerae bacterium]NIU58171.1 nucleotide sugar dehydrogenase [Phycisphaerae bacterium]